MKPIIKVSQFIIYSIIAAGYICIGCNNSNESIRPNILFCIADDWGWPHAGIYGDSVIHTPTFDRLAEEGVLFDHAYVSSPSCTPSRSAILTGQHFWRLGEAANLWSTLDVDIPVYPRLLEKAGYHVGSWRKSWGPGDLSAGNYDTIQPAGTVFPQGFPSFLADKPEDKPFCFWLGASDPHRPYEAGTGVGSGIDINEIQLPAFYPESETIRSDIADYYFEVQRFDSDVASAIHILDSIGELENTIIVVTGDHGMPFPRCKGNLYDLGARVPLVIKCGKNISRYKTSVTEIVSLVDLAPTFLAFAGVEIPDQMTGRSLKSIVMNTANKLTSEDGGFTVFGRERHTPAQLSPSIVGYPSRAIRVQDYLYIHNFFPDRWPAGVAEGSTHPYNTFSDCDAGPTKSFLMENSSDPLIKAYYDLSFGKRPSEELYAVKEDPYQIKNIATDPKFEIIKQDLKNKLFNELIELKDPRMLEKETVKFDKYPYRAPYDLNK